MTKKKSPIVISVDVSKEKLDIYNSKTNKFSVVKNNPRAIGSWISKINETQDIEKVILEPTGGYEDNLLLQLNKNKIKSYLVHPNKLVAFKKAKGLKAKTDCIDAFCIYEYAINHEEALKPVDKAYFETKKIKELVRTRKQIQAEIQRYKNFSEHGFSSNVTKQHNKRTIRFLEKELEKLEAAIKEAIEQNKQTKRNVELLRTIDGVGIVTANSFVAGVPELGIIDSNKLASLIGVAPFNHDSGKKTGKRSICGGRADLRATLYMAALAAIKKSPKMRDVYNRIIAKGKAKKVAIVAVMRRLLRIMNAVIRDQKAYESNNGLTAQLA